MKKCDKELGAEIGRLVRELVKLTAQTEYEFSHPDPAKTTEENVRELSQMDDARGKLIEKLEALGVVYWKR